MSDFKETSVKIPCCICGIMITPNPSNMCVACFRRQMDDQNGSVPEKSEVVYCRDCGRYQVNQTQWINAELESPELLQLCLKKLPQNIRVIEAKFLFTEPHSKRLRVQVTFEREDFNGTILRQSQIITYFVHTVQCKTCQELATHRDHWKAIVQLRQHSHSKRTLFWLEQQLITHGVANSASAIERKSDGLDFQFNDKSSAEKLVSFLKGIIPLEVKQSNQVKGQDLVNMQYDTRFTYSLKCPPISREDLVILPKKVFESTGRQSPLCLVTKIGRAIRFVNPFTGHSFVVDGKIILTYNFEPLLSHDRLVQFAILSKDIISKNGDYEIADFEITDVETYDERVIVRSHLGKLLNEGDICTAYDLRSESLTDENEALIRKLKFERIVIVGKYHEPKPKKAKKYKVKTLAPTMKEDDKAIEEFLDEIEDNPDLAEGVTLIEE